MSDASVSDPRPHPGTGGASRWNRQSHHWDTLQQFETATTVPAGLHSIPLASVQAGQPQLRLQFYFRPVAGAPLLVHFHGNSPRRPDDLPVVTGLGVTEGIAASLLIPSDPLLSHDPELTLAWHTGTRGELINVTRRVVLKAASVAGAPHIVAWGGSGGGFAALKLAQFIDTCIAFVWNPQTNIRRYAEKFVERYAAVAYANDDRVRSGADTPREWRIDDAEFWSAFRGRALYFQERSDWHFESHLGPVLEAHGKALPDQTRSWSGWLSEHLWIHASDWGPGHVPPPKAFIKFLLRELATPGLNIKSLVDGLTPAERLINAARVLQNRLENIADAPKPYDDRVDLNGAQAAFPFLTGDALEVDFASGVDWTQTFSRQANSNRMWLYSLSPVGRLCASPSDRAHSWAEVIIRSFLEFSSTSPNRRLMENVPSADHSAATRVKSLVMFLQALHESPSPDLNLVADVLDELGYWSAWLCQPQNYKQNNHGLMASIALLHAAKQLEGTSEAADIERQAVDRITDLGQRSFDANGLCNENSIGYHNFNLHCYRQLQGFAAANGLDHRLGPFINELVERATTALRYALQEDGSIPTIGDSPRYRTALKPINSPKFFPDSGFAVVKNDELYVSMVCGAPSEIHKQNDDTSITVRWRGRDVLVDAGSYLYDREDPYRRAIESSRGHSGVYLRADEQFNRAELVRRYGAPSSEITHFVESGDSIALRSTVRAPDDRFVVDRRVLVRFPDEIVIVDHVEHQSEIEETGFVQRFLFGPDQLISGENTRFDFRDGKVGGSLFQLSHTRGSEFRGTESPPKGWCSFSYGVKVPTTSIEFHGSQRIDRFSAILKLDPRAGLNGCSAESLRFASGTHAGLFDSYAERP